MAGSPFSHCQCPGGSKSLIHVHCVPSLVYCSNLALTVPILVSASVWNGGSFLLDVTPRLVILKEKKSEMQLIQTQQDQSSGVMEDTMMMKLY
ncbi:hypothetical protein CFP56_043514 [Quercus suber]|uniref:Uncharacterized protein n=1 Tax=Quercus suber TaxID=58331 RepID=A0AAW0LHS8_QUESU